MKQKVLAFDIDGVICHTLGSDYRNSKPNKKAIEKLTKKSDEDLSGDGIPDFDLEGMTSDSNESNKSNTALKNAEE